MCIRDRGGDDFVPKPFDLSVLSAKVRSTLRRCYDFAAPQPVLAHRGAELDTADASLRYQGEKLDLSRNAVSYTHLGGLRGGRLRFLPDARPGGRELPHFQECRAYEIAQELKAEGKARHVGISFHDSAEMLEKILTDHPEVEVVQIQDVYKRQVSRSWPVLASVSSARKLVESIPCSRSWEKRVPPAQRVPRPKV